MAHDSSNRILAKLVLLQQACCDPRLDSSAKAALAVIVDACYDKPSCYIGPTTLARITGHNEKTMRKAIASLVAADYLRTERRNQRSSYLFPNFEHAESTGRLVSWDEDGQRVYRPGVEGPNPTRTAGVQTRYRRCGVDAIAGVQVPDSGPTRPGQRVSTPTETVLETNIEASRASAGAQARPRARDWMQSPESPLDRELSYIHQQHRFGAYGEGADADQERDRLLAAANARFPELTNNSRTKPCAMKRSASR